MNKHKHTPGPWAVEHPYGEGGIYVSGTNTALIAKIYHEQEANARLIAAAPDMLAALRSLLATAEAVDTANKNQHGHNCAGFSSNLFEFCHAAIRRAGGEA